MRLLERYAIEPAAVRRSSRKFLVLLGLALTLLVIVTGALAVMVGLKLFELISSGRGPL
jgi:purine-cytosine permease-like protein